MAVDAAAAVTGDVAERVAIKNREPICFADFLRSLGYVRRQNIFWRYFIAVLRRCEALAAGNCHTTYREQASDEEIASLHVNSP